MQLETSGVSIRRFRPDDETSFLQLQAAAFREFEYLPRVKAGLCALDPQGSFVAEKDQSRQDLQTAILCVRPIVFRACLLQLRMVLIFVSRFTFGGG